MTTTDFRSTHQQGSTPSWPIQSPQHSPLIPTLVLPMRRSLLAFSPCLLSTSLLPHRTNFAAVYSPCAVRSATRMKMSAANAPRKIGTHNGTFHCDEVLAVYMLQQTGEFAGSEIVRTRDEAVLSDLDIIVDVGGKYDAASNRFDHHQRTFSETFAPSGPRSSIKLSSAGLVYKHFGREVVSSVLAKGGVSLSQKDLETVYLHVYDSFMEAIDGIDNGVQQYECDTPARYRSSTDLSSRVGRLNAAWNAPPEESDQDRNFRAALALAGPEFDAAVLDAAKDWLPARAIVEKAVRARFADWAGGEILVLREWAPWKSHLFDIENEDDATKGKILYVVYKDSTGGTWRVQCVPVAPQSFISRLPLPKQWRGVRDEALSQESGIKDCVFVHAGGFIGGNKTFEGAMAMAKKSLTISKGELKA